MINCMLCLFVFCAIRFESLRVSGVSIRPSPTVTTGSSATEDDDSMTDDSAMLLADDPPEPPDGSDSNGTAHVNATGHSLRYHVAVFDFARVAGPIVIACWILIASLAKIGFHLNNRLSSVFPESCLLILLGLLLGFLLALAKAPVYTLSSETFFLFLLPPIILESGYFMPNRAFFENLGTILLFAIGGTVWSAVFVGLSVWASSLAGAFFSLPLLHCLVFAALLAAVDPVAVLAIFEEVHVNEALHIVLFGESLLNDAVSVVLYHMFKTYNEIGADHISALDVFAGGASFLVVAVGGTAVGVVCGLLAGLSSRFTDHVRVIEPLLVFLMGYLAYLTAEMFHMSGILACTFCGMTMRQYVEANVSQKSRTTIKYFMKMLASVCETIIFMFLGVSTVVNVHAWDTAFVALTLIFCLGYRCLGVVALSWLANRVRVDPLSRVDQFIMAYGGLRGAIAFSLVVLLNADDFPQKRVFVTTTVVVVYVTVFLQGSTIKPLVNFLKVKKAETHKPNMNEQIHIRMVDHLMAGIEDITGNVGYNQMREKFEYISNSYIRPLVLKKQQLGRGQAFVQVYRRLAETQLRENLEKGSYADLTHIINQPSVTRSMARLFTDGNNSNNINEDSVSCHEMNGLVCSNSATCLDLAVQDAQNSRKMRDDTKIHHILEDSMFQPRKRFCAHQRHMLPSETTTQPFHHKSRYHLRHMMSRRQHGDTASNPNTSISGAVGNNGRPRKNVSFADCKFSVTVIDDNVSKQADSSGTTEVTQETRIVDDDEDEDRGIVFSAAPHNGDEVNVLIEAPSDDTLLPWKRTSRAPLSSSATHLMPADDSPIIGEAPSWVDNATLCPTAEPPLTLPLRATHSHAALQPDDSPRLTRTLSEPAGVGLVSSDPVVVDEYGLPPPPWRHSDSKPDTACHTQVPDRVSSNVVEPDCCAPLPWHRADEDVTVMAWDHQNAADVTDSMPWRHATTSESDVITPPPWRQTSQTSQADDSLRPQFSLHSLRLSEAESKHSAQVHLHHMIERLSSGGGSTGCDGATLEQLDAIQLDCYDRVAQWLLDSEPDLSEPTMDEPFDDDVTQV